MRSRREGSTRYLRLPDHGMDDNRVTGKALGDLIAKYKMEHTREELDSMTESEIKESVSRYMESR